MDEDAAMRVAVAKLQAAQSKLATLKAMITPDIADKAEDAPGPATETVEIE